MSPAPECPCGGNWCDRDGDDPCPVGRSKRMFDRSRHVAAETRLLYERICGPSDPPRRHLRLVRDDDPNDVPQTPPDPQPAASLGQLLPWPGSRTRSRGASG